jgi:hypothetical protein
LAFKKKALAVNKSSIGSSALLNVCITAEPNSGARILSSASICALTSVSPFSEASRYALSFAP